VPLQQLFFLNSPFMQQQAEMLAQRLDDYTSDQQKIKQAYSLLFNRPPTQQEIEKGTAFLSAQGNSWPNYLQVLLSANEFLYVN
jgi:hypothetical protein